MRLGGFHRVRRTLLGFLVLALALGVWEAWARTHTSFLLPPASAVAERAWEVWPTTEFLTNVTASLKRLGAGYALGSVIGVSVGAVLGASQRSRRALEPLVEILRATPPIAIVPVAIVILGLDDAMRISVIAFGVTFPVLINTLDGVRRVSPEARDTASLLHLGRLDRSLRVYLPAALPSIFAGLRVALAIGVVMVVLSEFVAGQDGIGYYIYFQQSQYNVPEVYGGIVFLGVLGYVLNRVFLVVEDRALAWHRGAAGEVGR